MTKKPTKKKKDTTSEKMAELSKVLDGSNQVPTSLEKGGPLVMDSFLELKIEGQNLINELINKANRGK